MPVHRPDRQPLIATQARGYAAALASVPPGRRRRILGVVAKHPDPQPIRARRVGLENLAEAEQIVDDVYSAHIIFAQGFCAGIAAAMGDVDAMRVVRELQRQGADPRDLNAHVRNVATRIRKRAPHHLELLRNAIWREGGVT